MTRAKTRKVLRAILATPEVIRARPSLNMFMLRYLRKFRIRDIGGNLIVHSHLPPLNSAAYRRFIREHLLGRSHGPSHAQIGLTNACPQKCSYCYNRGRKGALLDKSTIMKAVQDLKDMGVFWLGWTGGEPLLNEDIVEITEKAAESCAVKLFTTGCTLTKALASDLHQAGLFSASISLDHWKADEHDRARGYAGAYRTALRAIEIFKSLEGLHVGVSAVLSLEMIQRGQAEEFLRFLIRLGVDEAWLSEMKPSLALSSEESRVITEEDRLMLVRLQDKYNREGKITVNYLAHFEGREHFGCNAGHKMVFIDPFGEVGPCVFAPLTFGNIRERSVRDIFADMKKLFPSENRCFVNANFDLFRKFSAGEAPISREKTLELMKEVRFEHLAEFFKLYYHQRP